MKRATVKLTRNSMVNFSGTDDDGLLIFFLVPFMLFVFRFELALQVRFSFCLVCSG
jgi:hypothetical protein